MRKKNDLSFMWKPLYSKGCKCTPKCQVSVSAWIDGRALGDDPHRCYQCRRFSKKVLPRMTSGIYSCGRQDCFSHWIEESSRKMQASKDPVLRRWSRRFDKLEKELQK